MHPSEREHESFEVLYLQIIKAIMKIKVIRKGKEMLRVVEMVRFFIWDNFEKAWKLRMRRLTTPFTETNSCSITHHKTCRFGKILMNLCNDLQGGHCLTIMLASHPLGCVL